MNCELCSRDEAVHAKLCQSCGEMIRRLALIRERAPLCTLCLEAQGKSDPKALEVRVAAASASSVAESATVADLEHDFFAEREARMRREAQRPGLRVSP